jgi:hypothetical protein
MRKLSLIVLSLALVAGVAEARKSTSALGDGAGYQAMIGIGGRFDVPFTTNPPKLDGVLGAGEWDKGLHTFFGPSTLAQWAEKVGYKANQPGYVVADGLVSQLAGHPAEDAAEVNTDADIFVHAWKFWDNDYMYYGVNVTDNVHDVTGDNDGAFWTRDGMFIEFDFLGAPSTADGAGTIDALCFAAIPIEEQRYSIIYWNQIANYGQVFYGDDPKAMLGSTYGFSLTDEGYIIEARASWAYVSRYLDAKFAPYSGWEFGDSYHILDPDGGEGFGGQFQFGRDGDAGNVPGWATWILAGGPAATAVESTTWGAVKASYR